MQALALTTGAPRLAPFRIQRVVDEFVKFHVFMHGLLVGSLRENWSTSLSHILLMHLLDNSVPCELRWSHRPDRAFLLLQRGQDRHAILIWPVGAANTYTFENDRLGRPSSVTLKLFRAERMCWVANEYGGGSLTFDLDHAVHRQLLEQLLAHYPYPAFREALAALKV